MTCKHCAGKVDTEHLFCPFCGEKIEKEEPKEEVVQVIKSEEITEEKTESKEEVVGESTEELKEESKEEINEKLNQKEKSNNRFTTLLFSIMFVFSLLAVAMALQSKAEVEQLQQNIYALSHQLMAKQGTPAEVEKEEPAITGAEVRVTQIAHFSNGDIHTTALNVSVPEGVFFQGIALNELTPKQEEAFANELLKTSWHSVSEESVACYPNLQIQLLVNDVPYAFYDGKTVSLH